MWKWWLHTVLDAPASPQPSYRKHIFINRKKTLNNHLGLLNTANKLQRQLKTAGGHLIPPQVHVHNGLAGPEWIRPPCERVHVGPGLAQDGQRDIWTRWKHKLKTQADASAAAHYLRRHKKCCWQCIENVRKFLIIILQYCRFLFWDIEYDKRTGLKGLLCVFHELCRRKAMSGNWKTNVGAATLEQIPLTDRQAD